MTNELVPVEINQFSGNLIANILAKTPIIGIDYKNTDKSTVYLMLVSLLRQLNIELWFLGLDNEGEHYILQCSWKSAPKKIDPALLVPESERPKVDSEDPEEYGLDIGGIILKYILPKLGTNKILAFYSDGVDYDWYDNSINLAETAHEYNQTVLVLTDNFIDKKEEGEEKEKIDPRLKKFGFFMDHWAPNEKELAQYLKLRLKGKRLPSIEFKLNDDEILRMASLLNGCGFLEAEKKFDVFAMEYYLKYMFGKKHCVIDKDMVDKFEENIKGEQQKLENLNGVERVSLDKFDMNSIAGLENLKSWLETARKLSTPQKIGEMRVMGWDPPRGVLLMGVPGCGKSLSAKCIAASFGLPLYRLDFATVQNMYVGESERRLKEVFDSVDTRSPCVLWIDEIEKGLATSDIDSYTKKLLGMFLNYLQESKSSVFVVATSNDVQKLPPELLRKGRFDEIFFVDLPNEAERKEILKMYLKKYLKMNLSESFAEEAIAATEGFAASDIESTLSQLGRNKLIKESTDVSESAILKLFSEVTSLYRVNPEKVEDIREWGLNHAVPASKG